MIDKTATTAGAGVVNPDDPNNTTATSCQVRDYAFDANGNRTSLTRTPSAANGSCQGANPTGVTTKSTAYDAADRMTTTGYVYDPLGRVTAIPQADTPAAAGGATPGALTLGYYDTDAARTITQSGKSTVYTLDTAGRRSTSTTTSGSTTSTIVRHYTDGSDNPGWTASTDATSSTPTIERMAGGLSGDLGLTIQGDGKVQLAIANLHGDIVSQVTLPTTGNATGIDSWQDADEYGNTIGGTAGITPTNADGKGLAYGSLGAKERATDTTGLTLMGARVYNSSTGQFSSTDPVFGGNATPYAYPQDPVDQFDTNGLCFWDACVGEVIVAGLLVSAIVASSSTPYYTSRNYRSTNIHVHIHINYRSWSRKAALQLASGILYAKKKTTRQSGKEKANDVPDRYRGETLRPGQSVNDKLEELFGKNPDKKPTSEYSRMKKKLTRKRR